MKWTTVTGDEYEIRHKDGNYLLYVNNNFTQCIIKADGMKIEDASRVLVNQYNEANDAEVLFFKNNPQLNP